MKRALRSSMVAATAMVTATAALAASSAARADGAKPASLSWVRLPGAESCISGARLAALVEGRLGKRALAAAGDAEVHIEGRIEPTAAGGWKATLVLNDRKGAALGTRALASAATSCGAIEPELALVLAVMIDPDAALAPASAPGAASPGGAAPGANSPGGAVSGANSPGGAASGPASPGGAASGPASPGGAASGVMGSGPAAPGAPGGVLAPGAPGGAPAPGAPGVPVGLAGSGVSPGAAATATLAPFSPAGGLRPSASTPPFLLSPPTGPAPPPSPSPWRWRFGAGPALSFGLVPLVGAGVALHLAVTPPRFWTFEATALITAPTRATGDFGSGEFLLATGGLAACPLSLTSGAWRSSACAGFELGSVRASGLDLPVVYEREQWVANVALRGRGERRLIGPLSAGAGVAILVPLVRGRFVSLDGAGVEREIFVTSPVAGSVELSLGLELP